MAGGGRRRGFIFIILALIIIAGLVVVGLLFRNQIMAPQLPQQTAQQPAQKMISIVITTQAVPRGSTLTEAVLTTIPYPEQDVVQGVFFTNVNDVIGKQVKFDLEPRVPLTASMIATGALGSNAAFQIPRGMVAISIPISRLTAVSYAPMEGDHVNILVSLLLADVDQTFQSVLPNASSAVIPPNAAAAEGIPPSITANIAPPEDGSKIGRVELDTILNQPIYSVPSEDQRPRLVSQTLIQDAIVLRMGNFELEKTAAANAAQPTPTPIVGGQAPAAAPAAPDVITLIVRPQDAVTLNYLMLAGAKLNLVLRSAGDLDPIQTEAVTLQFLMQQYNIPDPSKLPFSMEPRIDGMLYPIDDEASPAKVITPAP